MTNRTAVVFDEISQMAWERVIEAHPDRAIELHLVYGMVRRATQLILHDPDLTAELKWRIRQARSKTNERTNLHSQLRSEVIS